MAEEIIRYGAGGKPMVVREIVEPDPKPVKKKETKKVQVLEERIHDTLPSDTEPTMELYIDEEALHLGEDE